MPRLASPGPPWREFLPQGLPGEPPGLAPHWTGSAWSAPVCRARRSPNDGAPPAEDECEPRAEMTKAVSASNILARNSKTAPRKGVYRATPGRKTQQQTRCAGFGAGPKSTRSCARHLHCAQRLNWMFYADINIGSRNVGKNQPRRGTYASVHHRGGYRSNCSCIFGSPNVGRSYLRRSDPAEWQMLVLGKALIPE